MKNKFGILMLFSVGVLALLAGTVGFISTSPDISDSSLSTGDAFIKSHNSEISILTEIDEVVVLYVLQMDSPASPALDLELEDATITFSADVLTLTSGSDSYYFGLEETSGSYTEDYVGYGLTEVSNDDLIFPPETGWEEVYSPTCNCTQSAECQSGGLGSSSCSISDDTGSCTVTCTGSFYSCCNPTES